MQTSMEKEGAALLEYCDAIACYNMQSGRYFRDAWVVFVSNIYKFVTGETRILHGCEYSKTSEDDMKLLVQDCHH